jgi:hypothetical protein
MGKRAQSAVKHDLYLIVPSLARALLIYMEVNLKQEQAIILNKLLCWTWTWAWAW